MKIKEQLVLQKQKKKFQSANNNDVLIEGIESFNKGRDENEVIENNELEIQNSFVEGEKIEMGSNVEKNFEFANTNNVFIHNVEINEDREENEVNENNEELEIHSTVQSTLNFTCRKCENIDQCYQTGCHVLLGILERGIKQSCSCNNNKIRLLLLN